MKAIAFDKVSKEYQVGRGSVKALDQVSFGIEPQKVTVILGPSGSGKSTILNLMGGMDHPTSGKIEVFQEDISGLSEKALTIYRRQKIGFVFQFYNLIPSLNALENISIVEKMTHHAFDAGEMIARVGLADRKRHFPAELSGGEMQRLSIARALCKNPDILLCDEPTGALDYKTSKEILGLIENVNRRFGSTVIMVTHNEAIRHMADHVVTLLDGRIRKDTRNASRVAAADLSW